MKIGMGMGLEGRVVTCCNATDTCGFLPIRMASCKDGKFKPKHRRRSTSSYKQPFQKQNDNNVQPFSSSQAN